MILYDYTDTDDEKIEPIYHDHLQMFAKNLQTFIDVYRKSIYLPDEKHVKTLDKLQKYVDVIQQRRYDLLLVDPKIVSFEKPPIESFELEHLYRNNLIDNLNDDEVPF